MTARRPCDDVTFFCLGALDGDELSAFDAHLASCASCTDEVEASRVSVASLGLSAPAAEPPPGLWGTILARARELRRDAPSPIAPSQGDRPPVRFVFAGDDEWQETGVEGARSRLLSEDTATGRRTLLMRMDPGVTFPTHRHGGYEECFVVEGDLLVGDTVMRAGDYQRAEPDTLHDAHSTEGGCLLLIMSGGFEIVGS